jgi:alpha-tubulin suppressor-like RCC1 family protein
MRQRNSSPTGHPAAAPPQRTRSLRLVVSAALAVPLLALLAPLVLGAAVIASPSVSEAAGTQHLYSWGNFGEDGSVNPGVDKPTLINGIPGTITQLVASNSATYALTSSGAVWAFGANDFGELGNGQTTDSFSIPVEVQFPAGTVIASLPSPMPYASGLAIDTKGNAWGWGINQGGELCLGEKNEHTVPVELPFTDVTLATGAGNHATYEAGGKLYSCGANQEGQLGTGNTKSSRGPVAVVDPESGTSAVTDLFSSWGNTGALLADGTFWEWGLNKNGQVGDGNLFASDSPVEVQRMYSTRRATCGPAARTRSARSATARSRSRASCNPRWSSRA